MSRVFIFPIESQPMRYSDQWLLWLVNKLIEYNIEYKIVNGDYWEHKLKQGGVFDDFATNHWKLTQIDNFIKLWRKGEVKNGDKIFDLDLWHSGLESIAYINADQRLDLKIYGIFHAGTFDRADFTYLSGMEHFGRHLEKSWASIAEKIFVGSDHIKKMITSERNIFNVVNTGLPLDYDKLQSLRAGEKKDIVVWTARLAEEKDYETFRMIRGHIKGSMPNVDVVATQELELPKDEYYKLLASAKVVLSTAKQENFGIGVIEGMALGCTPVVPDGLSYLDYVPDRMRFKNTYQAIELVKHYLAEPVDVSENVKKYSESYDKMLKEMELI